MAVIAITNIGTLVTGDISNPLREDDTILIQDGRIAGIGGVEILKNIVVDKLIDVSGMTVTPGPIDSHVHPVLGDYTPRQKTQDYLD
ncbi:MAG TPA: Enamidase, partial [Pelotomaculum sp.]|nr:Enamidase [Pelotomaculum sp.]